VYQQTKSEWLPFAKAASAMVILTMVLGPCTAAQVPKSAVGGAIRPRGHLERTAFYDVATQMPSAAAGKLIRVERVDEYSLAPEESVIRFVYHSRSNTGADVPVSAVVVIPPGKAPPSGWPVVAWAHDFQGLARDCAPSLQANLVEGSYFSMYARLGFAVVASDFSGLGVGTSAPYWSLSANANDVIYSVQAAREAAPQLGKRWAVIGEGDGGVIATGIAENKLADQDRNYVGSVALGGLFELPEAALEWEDHDPGRFLQMTNGIERDVPGFVSSQLLSKDGMKAYQEVARSCSAVSPSAPVSGAIATTGWYSNPAFQKYAADNSLGRVLTQHPMLIITSATSHSALEKQTRQTIKRLCALGDAVLFYTYDSPDAQALVGDSVRDQLSWIRDRFANRAYKTNCE